MECTTKRHQKKYIFLQVSTLVLLDLNRFKEGLEVAGAKSLMIIALDDLQEHSGPIL